MLSGISFASGEPPDSTPRVLTFKATASPEACWIAPSPLPEIATPSSTKRRFSRLLHQQGQRRPQKDVRFDSRYPGDNTAACHTSWLAESLLDIIEFLV